MDDIIIEIESENTDTYELVFSKSFSVLNKNDKIKVKLSPNLYNWVYELNFIEDKNKPTDIFKIATEHEGNIIRINFFNWTTTAPFIELIPAHITISQDKKINLFLKVRTTASNKSEFRFVSLTLWKKLNV